MIGLNAVISGTGSDLGAFRVSEQLLKYKPDLIFIEFAVNGAFAAAKPRSINERAMCESSAARMTVPGGNGITVPIDFSLISGSG